MNPADWNVVALGALAAGLYGIGLLLDLAEARAARASRRFADTVWRVGEESGQIRITG